MTLKQKKWDSRFMRVAVEFSTWSKDPSTKVGCVIANTDKRIVSQGFNGFPKGTPDDAKIYENRPEKYRRVVHAEANAIALAKVDLAGCTLYTTAFPCSQCAGLIIQSDITRVVSVFNPDYEDRWTELVLTTKELFKAAGVKFEYIRD